MLIRSLSARDSQISSGVSSRVMRDPDRLLVPESIIRREPRLHCLRFSLRYSSLSSSSSSPPLLDISRYRRWQELSSSLGIISSISTRSKKLSRPIKQKPLFYELPFSRHFFLSSSLLSISGLSSRSYSFSTKLRIQKSQPSTVVSMKIKTRGHSSARVNLIQRRYHS